MSTNGGALTPCLTLSCRASSWYRGLPTFSRLLLQFVLLSLALTLFFWLARIGIMKDADYSRKRHSVIEHPVWDALYQSIMTQTTVGSSDISPISVRAQVMDGVQALSTFLGLGVLAILYASAAPK